MSSVQNTESNWESRTLYHGDNLVFLRGINSHTVDLIATDPPFNKGYDFFAKTGSRSRGAKFQDRWNWDKDVHQEWVDQLKDDWPHTYHVIEGSRNSYGDDMGAFLCFMAVRLVEMRRILKQTGSIYLHCDPTASHYLKELLDAIFGKKNFINEIIWFKGYRGTARKKRYQQEHDTVFLYAKSSNHYNWNPIYGEYKDKSMKRYNKIDDEGRRYAKIKRRRANGDVYYGKCYPKGKLLGDVIDVPILAATASERTDYPTQKPIELYRKFIQASSNQDEVVFDPFCGCATTLIAAEQLKRKWVGMDIWDGAHQSVIDRLQKECFLDGPEKERMDILISEGKVYYKTEAPVRTDDGVVATPFLKVKMKEPEEKMSRDYMFEKLIEMNGIKCAGCNRIFDDKMYLVLDHSQPKSDGGINAITNRILLCHPCNTIKSNKLTLSGLVAENKRRGRLR